MLNEKLKYDGDWRTFIKDRYFYLHDRLGSVREIINDYGNVVMLYTYNPYGEVIESSGEQQAPSNCFMFTGQWYDDEIDQYFLRARQGACPERSPEFTEGRSRRNPILGRFIARDPVFGQFEDPLSLHKYLYCQNNSINAIDPEGLWTIHVMFSGMLSLGPSLMYQVGIVFDDEGNVGWIIISNDSHPIDPTGIDERVWGGGLGVPAASIGISFGWTNADTIFDLVGPGIQIGGSAGIGWGVGVDYIQGIQRSGEYYYGLEVVPQYGGSSTGLWEVHGQATWTSIMPLNSKQQDGIDLIRSSVENAIFDIETVGQGYGLLVTWAYLE